MQDEEPAAKRPAVLLIDPDPERLPTLRDVIASEGAEVRAYEMLSPSALTPDLAMVLVASEGLGERVLPLFEELHDRLGEAVPVVALLGRADAADLEALDAAGCHDFIHARQPEAFLRMRLRGLLRERRRAGADPVATALGSAAKDPGALEEMLQGVVERSLHDGSSFALFHLGLDNFKRLNAALGRTAGDQVLSCIQVRLVEALRAEFRGCQASDATSLPVFSRISGDEFVLVVPELASESAPNLVARRALEIVSRPIEVGSQKTVVTACIGITVGPEDGQEPRLLLHNASEAMQQAKDTGRNCYHFHSRSGNRQAYADLMLETRLRGAVERGELMLYYQPKVDADTRRIAGLEALIRWHDAELGPVSPGDFIPLAESTELIVPIGIGAVETACRQLQRWRSVGLQVGRVAINVSPRQFMDPSLVESILEMVERCGAHPRQLELEITEGCLLNGAGAIPKLERLREAGFSVAIDDFGTGYSSLQYLRKLPLDSLKIDRAFIKDLEVDETARSLTAVMISLAWSLGLKVVAEGVETEGQWRFLLEHGCDEIQGFAFSRALPAEECEELLRAQGPGGR